MLTACISTSSVMVEEPGRSEQTYQTDKIFRGYNVLKMHSVRFSWSVHMQFGFLFGFTPVVHWQNSQRIFERHGLFCVSLWHRRCSIVFLSGIFWYLSYIFATKKIEALILCDSECQSCSFVARIGNKHVASGEHIVGLGL